MAGHGGPWDEGTDFGRGGERPAPNELMRTHNAHEWPRLRRAENTAHTTCTCVRVRVQQVACTRRIPTQVVVAPASECGRSPSGPETSGPIPPDSRRGTLGKPGGCMRWCGGRKKKKKQTTRHVEKQKQTTHRPEAIANKCFCCNEPGRGENGKHDNTRQSHCWLHEHD